MRSKPFVPGSRPELFAKALAGEADALSLDLEDDRKAEALHRLPRGSPGPTNGSNRPMRQWPSERPA